MPYIKREDRKTLHKEGLNVFESLIARYVHEGDVGSLNYIISYLIHVWLKHVGLRYHNLNAAIGVLECVKQELYRRIAAPYENIKIVENGPVSELDGEL